MTDNLQPPPSRRPRTVDAVVAVALFACSFPGSLITLPGRDLGVAWWPGVLLAGVSCVGLLWRRYRPRATVVLTLGCAMAAAALGYLLTVLLLAPLMVALYSLAVGTDRRTANTFTVTGIALLVGTGVLVGPAGEPLVLRLLGPAAWLLLPTSLGTVTRLRAAYLDAERARAEHAERTREEEARHRVTEERMRIARDLHDVVAHHLVLANLQAGAVARQLPGRPDEAVRIASDLTGTTASALRELKSTVGLLRREGDTDKLTGNADRPPEPTPGLAQLPELAASFENAGLAVTVSTEGEPGPLSTGADLTAYRIVQEALTNVTKHAGVHSAEVRLVYTRDRLTVTVANGGGARSGTGSPPGGYGVIGMHERARSVGGHIRVGPRPTGGFEVIVELPLGAHQLERTSAD
ncbi:sensor histidine kinase [Streptomyces pseudovenezuelae]|uniref:histidine kinase n=1 Tax=Streptomyces pseudovenezuelae TaxID=67350 RepID=A0ABT6L9V3_9ACTN|nr:sensor histidine kinase [Streptomyces pseudovenezuelae]MDH6212770.1 signal transduction histidine kinase [Streptomyces pseudovenezuelae]